MQYANAYSFREGLAPVALSDGHGRSKWGFVDRRGRMVIRPQFDYAWQFYEGLASVQFDNLWGAVDKSGRLVVPLRYSKVGIFHGGLAEVQTATEPVKSGYVNRQGKLVWKPTR